MTPLRMRERVHRLSAKRAALLALAMIPIAFGVFLLATSLGGEAFGPLMLLFLTLAAAQLALGIIAVVLGVRQRRRTGHGGVGPAIVGGLTAAGAVAGGILGPILATFASGGAWGRPLRIRGRQLHPELREGSDWTAGDRPDPTGLDATTCAALEALWLHDAQKEHASVPAFARVSWLLAAAGAPAELLAGSHRAAIEEIEHAQACFALAAGYGGRTHTVEPMPELLVGGLDVSGDVFALLATESLTDGGQLEDFNADVAAACADVCTEPVTRAVLERIAREERAHASLSWAIVDWAAARSPATVLPALERALAKLADDPRPTAVSAQVAPLVARADQEAVLRHGRLPDARWQALWDRRLDATRARVRRSLAVTTGSPRPRRPAVNLAD